MVTGDNLRAAGSFGSKSGLLSRTPEWALKEFSFFGCDSKVLKNVRESVNARETSEADQITSVQK